MTKEKRNRPTTGDSPLKMGSLWIQAYRLNPSKPSSQESRGFNHGSVNFDQITAAELDRQSGVTVSRKGKPRASTKPGDGWGMTHTGAEYDDMGGASRFYPVFRYCSKASPSERPKVDGILHPTASSIRRSNRSNSCAGLSVSSLRKVASYWSRSPAAAPHWKHACWNTCNARQANSTPTISS